MDIRNRTVYGSIAGVTLLLAGLLLRADSTPVAKTAPPVQEATAVPLTQEQAFARLREVVIEHPRPEITGDFQSLFEAHKIAFASVDGKRENIRVLSAVVVLRGAVNGRDQAVLQMDPMMLGPCMPVQFIQRKVLHEYSHAHDYFTGRFPPSFFYLPPDTHEVTITDLEATMASEMDAYTAECQFAVDIHFVGFPDQLDECLHYAKDGRYGLALWLAKFYGTTWDHYRPFRKELEVIAETYR